MKRSLPSTTREVFCALVAVMASGTACDPDQGVEPGAPVLTKIVLVAPGPTPIQIDAATPACASTIVGGEACDPSTDGLCQQSATSWCTCVPDATDDTMGAWDCAPFPVLAVIAVFDRLLNTEPFDIVYPKRSGDVVTGTAGAGAPQFGLLTDYASTGTPMGITPLFSFFFNGNFRNNGPSLFSTPDPGFPSATAVTVTLVSSQVRAKDGTSFIGEGMLAGGTVGFTTPPFSGTIALPDDMNPDPRVIFTSYVADSVKTHITVTADGADITATVDLNINADTVTITPKPMMSFPAGATIAITVDATAPNALGQPIAAAVTDSFTAM
jgi:hypothetical protein